jgi:hypothetical protein
MWNKEEKGKEEKEVRNKKNYRWHNRGEADMCMMKCAELFTVLPAVGLLSISYFVLVVNRKIEAGALRAFGYVLAALLWISALLAFSVGSYKGDYFSKKCMMRKILEGREQGAMHRPMMPGQQK